MAIHHTLRTPTRAQIRRKAPQTIEELKAALREELGAITMHEIRRRIAEMPASSRCREVTRNRGRAVRNDFCPPGENVVFLVEQLFGLIFG